MINIDSTSELQDPLGKTLHCLRLHRCKSRQSELNAPWGLDMPAAPGYLVYHIVTAGECLIELDGQVRKLKAGSIALVTAPARHVLLSSEGQPALAFEDVPVSKFSEHYQRSVLGGSGAQTRITSGMAALEHVAAKRLLAQMPALVVCDTLDISDGGWLYGTLKLIDREARTTRPAGESILGHLTSIFVLKVIRFWLATAGEAQEGWLGALRDYHIGNSLVLMHEAPGKAWTANELAAAVGLPNGAFVARFEQLTGQSVKQYLLAWRMQLARIKLRQDGVTVSRLARCLGYRSESAFSRAFKRYFGISPSQFGFVARRAATCADGGAKAQVAGF
ncbi:AraC family transcriptional regulator [Granulosicoccaceae sp. 1_MG-2023]|nr:AraC family transcriptional regulator [Granulosicoccaceae sp. 1_MG-2023]